MIPVRGERPPVAYPTRLRPPTLTFPRQRYSMTPLSSRAGPVLDLHRSRQRRVLRTFDTRAARLEMLGVGVLIPGLLVPPRPVRGQQVDLCGMRGGRDRASRRTPDLPRGSAGRADRNAGQR